MWRDRGWEKILLGLVAVREKYTVEAKMEGRGPPPVDQPQTHTQTHTNTAHYKTAPTPCHDLPRRFTWPSPRTAPGPSP